MFLDVDEASVISCVGANTLDVLLSTSDDDREFSEQRNAFSE